MRTRQTQSSLSGVVAPTGVVTAPLLAQTIGSRGFQPGSAQAGDGRRVTQADAERWRKLTNRGRWGAETGTLNLITPAKRRQAAALVRKGISVPLVRHAETAAPIDGPRSYQVIPLGVTLDETRINPIATS